jgi:pyridoxamine 5'-phosphate oxidase
MAKNFHHERKDYSGSTLNDQNLPLQPLFLLETWLQEAFDAQVPEPTAMNLSTATADGKPSSRIVLLKEINADGLNFFTNYGSKKGIHLTENPYAAINFFWPQLERQVRMEGKVEKMINTESDQYFATRPFESQLAASLSLQSQPVESRKILDEKYQELSQKFSGTIIPRPEFWGGYHFKPNSVEFWQGRSNRMHDRILYELTSNDWKISRLYP